MKNLGDVIKEAIKRSPAMSLRKLEVLAGVTRSEISLIINKKRKRPTPRVLKKLAEPLKLDYTYLYTLAGYLDEKDYLRIANAKKAERTLPEAVHENQPSYAGLTRKKQEVCRMIQKLPDSEMVKIKDYLKLIRLKVKEEQSRKP